MSIEEYELYERDEPNLDGVERDLYEAISCDEPWALVERFSELVRESGSEDEREAAAYLTDRLSKLGVPHERYDPELWLSHPRDASLSVTSPEAESFDGVKTVSFSGSGTVRGELVHVPSPETADDRKALSATLDGVEVDVDGRIALVEANYLSRERIIQLEEKGAEAIVGVQEHREEPHEGIATPVWGGVPHPDETDRIPDTVIINTSNAVGEHLFHLMNSVSCLECEVSASAPKDWYECPLIVSRIPGEADPNNDDFVLLHGHYDSWHFGVTDNATGDAGLLELARVFNDRQDELERDLWVAWWPAHSTGRYAGSTWFTTEFGLTLDERCVAHVNMDSPGVKGATEFTEGVQWMPEVHDLCQEAIADTCGKPSNEHWVRRAGDYSFNNLGITGMFMGSSAIPMDVREARDWPLISGSGGHAEAWHLSTDTLDKADPDVLVRDTRVYATVVARLLNQPVLPLDHRRTVDNQMEHLAEYRAAAPDDVDLAPVVTEIEQLASVVDRFYDAVDAETIEAALADSVIKKLSRRLVRVDFATEGRFEQDPATHRPPITKLSPVTRLSTLEGDERKFQLIHLGRSCNEIEYELRRATEIVLSAL